MQSRVVGEWVVVPPPQTTVRAQLWPRLDVGPGRLPPPHTRVKLPPQLTHAQYGADTNVPAALSLSFMLSLSLFLVSVSENALFHNRVL